MEPIKHCLPINLERFGFVQRETIDGKSVPNQCGRDFFYYVLHYYYPEIHNSQIGNPKQITENRTFGYKINPKFAASMYGFRFVIQYLNSHNLSLEVNKIRVTSFLKFIFSMLFFKPMSYKKALQTIESSIDNGHTTGIDVSIAFGGLLSHVMFIYGYDEENIYVFDTHKVHQLDYTKITQDTDNRFIMKLKKSAIKKRWTIFNHVWVVKNK